MMSKIKTVSEGFFIYTKAKIAIIFPVSRAGAIRSHPPLTS